jgi:hypothetical protein
VSFPEELNAAQWERRLQNPVGLPQGAGAEAAVPSGEVLSQQALLAAIDQALAGWRAEGISQEALTGLARLNFSIGDLPDNVLGYEFGNNIEIDSNAAGYGWSTGRVDLVATLHHELGHALGFDHDMLGETLALTVGPLAASTSPASTAPPGSSAALVALDAGLALRSPSLPMVARPSTPSADITTAIAAARAEIASTAFLAFLGSGRTDSGALAASPGVVIPTSHPGVSDTRSR